MCFVMYTDYIHMWNCYLALTENSNLNDSLHNDVFCLCS